MAGAESFTVSSNEDGAGRPSWSAFEDRWRERGADHERPQFSASMMASARGSVKAARIGDSFVWQYQLANGIRTERVGNLKHEQVRLYILRRGSLTLRGADREPDHRIANGSFYLHHVTQDTQFETSPGVAVQSIVLPAEITGSLVTGKSFSGDANSPELQILLAHVGLIQQTVDELSTGGALAAGNAMVELVKGVALNWFDTGERTLVPALARAAQILADRLLEDPGASPARIASELHVSVRTLQRAFKATDESLADYIRRRRLELAAQALIEGELSVSEVAARWQFTDSSHFIRVFRQRYHRTPTQYAREYRSQH